MMMFIWEIVVAANVEIVAEKSLQVICQLLLPWKIYGNWKELFMKMKMMSQKKSNFIRNSF